MRSEALERCLSQDVRVTSLSSGAVLSKGIAKVLLAWGEGESQAQGPAAEPGQSLFVEDGQAGADAATLSLHLYPAPARLDSHEPRGPSPHSRQAHP